MSGNINILRLLPEVAAIGRTQLQVYCDEWLKRPIAQEYGVTHLIVGSDRMLTLNLDASQIEFIDNRIYVPIFELLDYVIDRHFQDPQQRHELHAAARDIRQRWGEVGYHYEAMAGRVGNLWLKCKNPNCEVSLETGQHAVEGQKVHCPPKQVSCPVCGHTDLYDGSDLHLRLPE